MFFAAFRQKVVVDKPGATDSFEDKCFLAFCQVEAKDIGFFDLFGLHRITPYGELYQRGGLKANRYSPA